MSLLMKGKDETIKNYHYAKKENSIMDNYLKNLKYSFYHRFKIRKLLHI